MITIGIKISIGSKKNKIRRFLLAESGDRLITEDSKQLIS